MPHRIVIVGGGAGGLELATLLGRRLGKRKLAHITLVDAQLTHVWKPLLHEVAAGSLDASEDALNYVAQAKWNHFEFQLGRMHGLDRARRRVSFAATLDTDGGVLVPPREMAYDTLVIAIGSTTNDFGTPGVAEHCTFLDTPSQAEGFHHKFLSHYLAAHAAPGQDHRVDIAIVGGGATGVELAAELRHAAGELAAYGLDSIDPGNLRITLLEAGPRLLPALPERISTPVRQQLERLGVSVRTATPVTAATAAGLATADGLVPASLKVWAAGIRAPAFLKNLDGLETNRINQLVVRRTLQTTEDENIFAMGDCAACPMAEGSDHLVPPRAQAAHQQAKLLARSLRRRIEDKPLEPFEYRDYGSLISLSKFTAVGNLMGNLMGSIKLEGWLARLFYVSLYRMHQKVLYGPLRTGLVMLGARIGRTTEPRLKLH